MKTVSSSFHYLCTYDLYSPVQTAFDAGSIHYLGKWEEVGPRKSRVFWALWNGIEPIGECHLGPKKLVTVNEISTGQQGWWWKGWPTATTPFYSRLLERYLKTTWPVFPSSGKFGYMAIAKKQKTTLFCATYHIISTEGYIVKNKDPRPYCKSCNRHFFKVTE